MWNGWTEQQQLLLGIAAAEGVILLLALVWVAVVSGKLRKVREAHRKMLGDAGVERLEDVLGELHERAAAAREEQRRLDERIGEMEQRLPLLKSRVGVHRFNAFADSGSDLSFSVAIVNDFQDGVVITGIHSREQTFLYAKPLDKGQSAYLLTPEEKTAITRAMQKE